MAENTSNRAFLMVAIVLGVLATVATFAYLQTSGNKDQGPPVKIFVAKHDLKPNVALDPEKDFEEMDVPKTMPELVSRALLPKYKSSYKAQRVNRYVLAGTPIMLADLAAPPGDLELSSPDMVALPLPVKGAQALAGILAPGDRVKVMVTRPSVRVRAATTMEADPSEAPSARFETVCVTPQPVRVRVIGSRVSRGRPFVTAADQYSSAGSADSQQYVTLETTEAQAANILEQTGAGQLAITLLLCKPPTTAPH